MTPQRFFKVVGSGNDFILLDQRRHLLPNSPTALARDWCDRRRGIGADGVLLVLPSRKADARMRIFNPDGSEAEMCGNGLRCVAWYLHARDHEKRNLRLETRAGLMQAKIVGRERVRIQWGPPKQLRLGLALTHHGKRYALHLVNTGVPHAVLFVRRLEAGWRLAMLSADRDLERQVQLPFTEQWKSTNGGIPVRLITAEVPIDGK